MGLTIKYTKESFVDKANLVHGNKYNYEKLVYKNSKSKVIITCPEHGEFIQTAQLHLINPGCKGCSKINRSLSQITPRQDFIDKASKLHNYKYCYDKVTFNKLSEPIIIICPEHGESTVIGSNHIGKRLSGCKFCAQISRSHSKTYSTIEFIERANALHNFKYNYDKTIYTLDKNKVIVTCKEHGDFEIRAQNHVGKQANGCLKCGIKRTSDLQRSTKEKFIEKAVKTHGQRYDYSLVNYNSNSCKVTIICKVHGKFLQAPQLHIKGNNCPKCKKHTPIQYDKFKEHLIKFKEIHNDYYDYSNSTYKGHKYKINIKCFNHGIFSCSVSNHLKGRGCPKCKRSKGELSVSIWLQDNKINYETQKCFDDCRNKKPLPFDFYLPDYNLLIEYQGEQHFRILTGNWKRYDLKERQRLDLIKKNYTIKNNFDFLEIKYNENINDKLNEYFSKKTKAIIN